MARTYLEFKEDANGILDQLEELCKEELKPLEGQRNSFDLSVALMLSGYMLNLRSKIDDLAIHADLFDK